ncbi:hypothetical protein AB0H57_30740 [Micromonospora sp. NPDC050686]|uniref:hypothetical protein n=1 Tax=Micromonospora sp. NPDC050686 TaxID=3154631 RepID=UPI003411CFF4
MCFVDIDSILRRVYGKTKQGVGFAHAKVGGYNVLLRGYNPLLATLSTLIAAPVVAAVRLRGGKASSAAGRRRWWPRRSSPRSRAALPG